MREEINIITGEITYHPDAPSSQPPLQEINAQKDRQVTQMMSSPLVKALLETANIPEPALRAAIRRNL